MRRGPLWLPSHAPREKQELLRRERAAACICCAHRCSPVLLARRFCPPFPTPLLCLSHRLAAAAEGAMELATLLVERCLPEAVQPVAGGYTCRQLQRVRGCNQRRTGLLAACPIRRVRCSGLTTALRPLPTLNPQTCLARCATHGRWGSS